jgi:hypothetical protein
MMDWLTLPLDLARAHEVGPAVAWHGRIMVLAWGILAPLAVIAARFFKIMPGQDWPRELDNTTWWRTHKHGQNSVFGLTLAGIAMALLGAGNPGPYFVHEWLGYGVLALLCLQVLLGYFRGSKGGPTPPAPDGSLRGDHYDMTPRRLGFEMSHKTLGYALLLLGCTAIALGLWLANAPRWMAFVIGLWWTGLLVLGLVLQWRGFAADTYQAIWGPDESHPGNRMPSQGWSMRRHVNASSGIDSGRQRE